MSTRSIALAFAVGAAAVPCSGQSINIDFGDGNGGPPADYAAAGLPGTWNVLTAPPDTATPLVGLDGAPLPAMIRATNGFGPVADMPIPHPELGCWERTGRRYPSRSSFSGSSTACTG